MNGLQHDVNISDQYVQAEGRKGADGEVESNAHLLAELRVQANQQSLSSSYVHCIVSANKLGRSKI